jgi:hypothetical protein
MSDRSVTWASLTPERATDAIAAAAVASPIWLPILETVSQVAGLLLPIVGLGWLVARVAYWCGHDKEDEQDDNREDTQ